MFFHPKTIISSICILIGSIWSLSYAIDKSNFIHKGTAEVRLNITESEYIPDSLNAYIITLSLFDKPFENSTIKMNRVDNNFNLSVPLYTNEALAGIIVESPHKRFAVGMIELNQNAPLIMTGDFNSDGALNISKSNNIGVNQYDLGPSPENKSIDISDIIYRFISYRIGTDKREPIILDEDYDDWTVVRMKLDSLFHVQLEYALNGRTIPTGATDWLINNLKYFYAANWLFNYNERAEKSFNIQRVVASPPLEYYTFLKDIDFSSLLNHSTVFGPYYLLNKILTQLPNCIKPIDNIPIEIWKTELKDKLSAVIPNPEPLLIDLLAITSYIQQINEVHKPLNNTQISNIKHYFNSDISSIILDINNLLISELDPNTIIIDHSNQHFSLERYLKDYPNTPVIIDFWNTWCSPCLKAHKEIGSFLRSNNFTGLFLRLNICDESSPLNEWEKMAPILGGLNIRISSNDMDTLLTNFDLTGFPSFLFFNNNHELVNKQTGFSEISQFKDAINKIITK